MSPAARAIVRQSLRKWPYGVPGIALVYAATWLFLGVTP
jgi:hypothetical protein